MAEPDLQPDSLKALVPPMSRLINSLVRTLLGVAVMIAVYGLLPLDSEDFRFAAYVAVLLGLALFVLIFIRELKKITRAENPALRGLESLAFVATFFVVVFASGYVILSQSYPAAFNQPLTKIDSFYFTVTVLSTVGFGDIHAVGPSAKVLVTLQMVLDLVLIGFAVRLLTTTAKEASRKRRASSSGS